MPNLNEKVSFYVSPSTYKVLKEAAKADKRKLSDWCRVLIESTLTARKAGR